MRGSPFFDDISQADVSARGFATRTPTFYYDADLVQAVFPARLSALHRLLPDPRFGPMRLAPGVGGVVVSCFAYRDSDLGPYDEISIGVLLCDQAAGPNLPGLALAQVYRRRQGHAFVVHMPVTTEPALALGADFFAFPKFLAQIRFTQTAGARCCRLDDRGEHVLTLSAGDARPAKPRVWQAFAHLWMDRQPQRAEVRMNQRDLRSSFRLGAARIVLGDRHPIAGELRRALLTDRSCALDIAPGMEAILFGPDHLTLPIVQRALATPAADVARAVPRP